MVEVDGREKIGNPEAMSFRRNPRKAQIRAANKSRSENGVMKKAAQMVNDAIVNIWLTLKYSLEEDKSNQDGTAVASGRVVTRVYGSFNFET